MKPKTRYNIRLPEPKGVVVRKGGLADLPLLFRLYLQTSIRDHFVIREEGYYLDVWSTFFESEMAEILIAEVDGNAVAALVLFHFGSKGWFLYGMSSEEHREKMPNYLLQWEAMRWARARGCGGYDLWGVPDAGLSELERDFSRRTDGLWGVYRFKRGFGGHLVRWSGTWDRVYRPGQYALFRRLSRWRQSLG